MALTAYTRFRFLWGAVDLETDAEGPTYGPSETLASVSDTVTARRAQLYWSRPGITEDRIMTHIDLLNITSGAPDETWTSTDYSNAEAAIDALWTTLKAQTPTLYTFDEIRWYRIGPGATKPEPAVRISDRNVAATGGTGNQIPQSALSVTYRTGSRAHWGRSYLPQCVNANIQSTNGMIQASTVDLYAGAVNTMITALAANDFYVVVYSKAKPPRQRRDGTTLPAAIARLYNVEKIQVDNVPDVIRRRRPTQNIYRKVLP